MNWGWGRVGWGPCIVGALWVWTLGVAEAGNATAWFRLDCGPVFRLRNQN